MGTRTGNATWVDGTSGTLITAASLNNIENALDTGGGKNWLPATWCLPGVPTGASTSNESRSAGVAYFSVFYLSTAGTVTDLAINVGTAATAGNSARLGVYSYPGTGSNWNRLSDAGTVAIDSTGDKTLSTLSIACPTSGLYAAVVLPQAACSLTSRSTALVPVFGPQSTPFATNMYTTYQATQAYGALPSTMAPAGAGGFGSHFPSVMVKLS